MTSSPNISASTTMNDDKLSGQLIIKAQLGDDIRKMMIHNEDLTLNELVLMMERIFTGKISNSDELTIKYLDDDGDKITLLNDSDLTVALHFHKLLRLFVFVNGKEQTNTSSTNKTGDFIDEKIFRTELQEIRNSVQTILDRLQLPTNDVSDATATVTQVPDLQKSSAATTENSQPNSNHVVNHEHQTVNAPQVQPTDMNKPVQTQMPTPHYVPPSVFKKEQDARTNTFGSPPTTFPGMPPVVNNTTPRFPPAMPPNTNAPPTIHSPSTPSTSTLGQQPPPSSSTISPPPASAQQGGFYSPQQNLYQQQKPSYPSYSTNNGYPPQQPTNNAYPSQQPTNNAYPPQQQTNNAYPPQQPTNNAYPPQQPTNNAYLPQQPTASSPPFGHPPSTAQQPYGAYPQQNYYYNPVQQ